MKLYVYSLNDFRQIAETVRKETEADRAILISVGDPGASDMHPVSASTNVCNIDFADDDSMTMGQAMVLANFIDCHLQSKDYDIYIHCNAGKSRSQGVCRFILDVYGSKTYRKYFSTRMDNPCITPNIHVSSLLKRAFRQILENRDDM